MFRRKPAIYTPMSRKSNNSRKLTYNNNIRLSNKNNSLKHKSILFIIIGFILSIVGVSKIIGNTVVFTPMRFINSNGGTSFAISAIVLFIGVVLIAINYRSFIGYAVLGIGISIICISILISLRLAFIQTSLIKTIVTFSMVLVGFIFIGKGIVER